MSVNDTILPVDTIDQGRNCKLLFLSVIYQALLDSAKSNRNNRRDLPQIIKTDWWRQIFIFAGVENSIEYVNKIIVSNCNRHETGDMNIRKSCRVYR